MERVSEAQATEVLKTQMKNEVYVPRKNHQIIHSFGRAYIHSHKKNS